MATTTYKVFINDGTDFSEVGASTYGTLVKLTVERKLRSPTSIIAEFGIYDKYTFTNWNAALDTNYLLVKEYWSEFTYDVGFGLIKKVQLDLGKKTITVEALGPLHELTKRYVPDEESNVLGRFPIVATNVGDATVVYIEATYPQAKGDDLVTGLAVNDFLNGHGLCILDRSGANRYYVTEAPTAVSILFDDGEDPTGYYTETNTYAKCAAEDLDYHTVAYTPLLDKTEHLMVYYKFTVTTAQKTALRSVQLRCRGTTFTESSLFNRKARFVVYDQTNEEHVPLSDWVGVVNAVTIDRLTSRVVTDDEVELDDYFVANGSDWDIYLGFELECKITLKVDQVIAVLSETGGTPGRVEKITDYVASSKAVVCAAADFHAMNLSCSALLEDDAIRDEAIIVKVNHSILTGLLSGLFVPASTFDTYADGYTTAEIGGLSGKRLLDMMADTDACEYWESGGPVSGTLTPTLTYKPVSEMGDLTSLLADLDHVKVVRDSTEVSESVEVVGAISPDTGLPYKGTYPHYTTPDMTKTRVEDRSLISDAVCAERDYGEYLARYGTIGTGVTYSISGANLSLNPHCPGYKISAELGGDFVDFDFDDLPVTSMRMSVEGRKRKVEVAAGTSVTMGWKAYAKRNDRKFEAFTQVGYHLASPKYLRLPCVVTGQNYSFDKGTKDHFYTYTYYGRQMIYCYTADDGTANLSGGGVTFTLPENFRSGGKVVMYLKSMKSSSGSTFKLSGTVQANRKDLTTTTFKQTWPASGTYDLTTVANTWTYGSLSDLSAIVAAASSNLMQFRPGDNVSVEFTASGSAGGTAVVIDADVYCEVTR